MSLSLDLGTDPRGLEVKTYGIKGLPDVRIGDYEISMADFRHMVNYVMTNTDLVPDDPRIALKDDIENMAISHGYNIDEQRFVYFGREPHPASPDGVSSKSPEANSKAAPFESETEFERLWYSEGPAPF